MTELYVMHSNWSNYDGSVLTQKTGDMSWKMRLSSPFYQLRDYENFYVEFEALYDHYISNIWKLHTKLKLEVYNTLCRSTPRPRIVINKTCYFDKCGQTECEMRSPIRFHFGKFRSVRASLVPKNGSLKGLVSTLHIQVIKESTVGMQLTPSDYFKISKNIEPEVVLRFKQLRYKKHDPKTRKYYVDKLGLISVSTVFRKQLSEKRNKNNENMRSYRSSKYPINAVAWVHFLRLLQAQKQELTKDTIAEILYLATKFKVKFLIAGCEEFLISTKQIPTTKKLRLAEVYHLAKLQLVALERMKIEILEKDKLDIYYKIFDIMGPKTLKALLSKFCEEEIEEEEGEEIEESSNKPLKSELQQKEKKEDNLLRFLSKAFTCCCF